MSIDARGRVKLTPEQDPMVLAAMRDLGGIDLTAYEIADAIAHRCAAKPPHQVDVLGRLASLRNKGLVRRHGEQYRGGWQIAPEHRERFGMAPALQGQQEPGC